MSISNTERVELTVTNIPGVLGRVVIHIRREGWNIKRLHVEDVGDGSLSVMEIDIEGVHTKLAEVAKRLLRLDVVKSIATFADGERTEIVRENAPAKVEVKVSKPSVILEKKPNISRILAVNPGSTSTKFAVYDGEVEALSHTIRHPMSETFDIPVLEQKQTRMNALLSYLDERSIDLDTLDAVVGRGGLLKPIESGTYSINNRMLTDLVSASASVHASALGAIIAADIAARLGIPSFVTDPIVVDEMDRFAKLTGMPGIERSSIFHALNQKAVARRFCQENNMIYENVRLVVAHLGGGITIGAHRYGRVIDVNDALSGEGPFTPERSGAIPALPIVRMCFSGEYTEEEISNKILHNGGVLAYLGTNDIKAVQQMIAEGDEFAALVLDSMAYQVSKDIGSMVAALEGEVDAILLTGGLARSTRFTGTIKQRVHRFAKVETYPGEDEMLALVQGALRVIKGMEPAAIYE
ncbi:putative butyrate kinase [Clostridia bacterium]|nr:putative butyrate kinase [Clostridia bacterium]